jgi:hypothetical protein
MKVILKPGEMSQLYAIDKAEQLIIKNFRNINCKASATFYPEKPGHDTVDFSGDNVFTLGSQFSSVAFYWVDCSDDEISFDFETM